MITIFLADDHAVIRDGLRLLLEAHPDLKVVGDADNGYDAVQQIAAQTPHIAILDIAMPDLNGIEAAQQIREVCPATQVIILSMHGSSSHIFRALQAGARGYLLKASAGLEVVEAVRAVHAGRRYLSQEISEQVLDDFLRRHEAEPELDPLAHLTPREREILQLLVEGKSNTEIADHLFLSVNSVHTYRSRLMQKLGLDNLPDLVRFAIQNGLTPLE
jgi:DNA-binding NarL/FixJ family response regulator